ncbi:MAG TPA: outer membrane lipoprotein-sorting protein [Candidatus Hydrogenedentes bacterium]|nr:outer membrane lipoprotein-sorting protein [Candidatus Hydrogenedentota bacterium]
MSVALAALLAALAASAFAQEGSGAKEPEGGALSVEQIVEKTNRVAYYQGKDGSARVRMTITDRQLKTRTKEFTILRRNQDEKDEEQNFYVYFHEPADERGTVFMVHKHVGKDDDRWLYLPALDVINRIAASDERTSFVGSHYFYEDVSGRGLDEDVHELVEDTGTYYVIKNTPKNPESVEFDAFKMWIHKETFLPVQVAFEKSGEVYRISKILKVDDIQGYKTVTKAQMTDEHIGGSTVIEYSDVKYDLDIPEDIFTERYLRNPPREYIE